jgi:hypothetical protein
MTQGAFLYGDPRRRQHNPGLSDALTVNGLATAVGASVVATLLAGKAGTGLAGTLVGATCAPVVTALFTTRRASGYLRAGSVIVLSFTALALTVVGFTVPEVAIGRSLVADRPGTLVPIHTDCDDGEDNDDDLFVDDEDRGCVDGRSLEESADWPECENGRDDDQDGAVDSDDPECQQGLDTEFSRGQCDNGVDDDGDGAIDVADAGCASGFGTEFDGPVDECDNGVDDDGDGAIDGADAGCASGFGTEFDGPVDECDNGVDDDGDGAIDGADAGCASGLGTEFD